MKPTSNIILLTLLLLSQLASAQQVYNIGFRPSKGAMGRYYLAQHAQDKFINIDSCVAYKNTIVFQGINPLPRGVYALLDDKKKFIMDFVIDDKSVFNIDMDDAFSNRGMTVHGSAANARMFRYLAHLDSANAENKSLQAIQKTGNAREKRKAGARIAKLNKEMNAYQDKFLSDNRNDLFCRLVAMTRSPKVPENIANDTLKSIYFRQHFWDSVDFSFPQLTLTPQFFDKTNYYFFGVLYYQEADTITKYANMLLDKVVDKPVLLRYFLDFICPRYQRATTHIGWDQVYVNLLRDYYLSGKCPWATQADLYSKKNEVDFLSQSLIGAHGQELYMADTNQSPNANDWISSHNFPQKYVILWFWDPDCTHCQKQTAELKELYNKMVAEGNKRFEVYAVGYEADVDKWKRYVREHQLPFVNVGGMNVNIDYQKAYNVHGAPTMIILNEKRDIIMNKTLPTDQIMTFLDEYEKRQKTH
jgi:thioredoxin-related protein